MHPRAALDVDETTPLPETPRTQAPPRPAQRYADQHLFEPVEETAPLLAYAGISWGGGGSS